MERVVFSPEHYTIMEERFKKFLKDRYEKKIALGDKVIHSKLTYKTYISMFRTLLSPDPKYYPNFSEGIEEVGDLKFPFTCEDVVKMITKMNRDMGYGRSTCIIAYSMFKNLFECMKWKWTINLEMLGLRDRPRGEAPYLNRNEANLVVNSVINSKQFNLMEKAIVCFVSLGIRPNDIVNLTAGNIVNIEREGECLVEIVYTPCKNGRPDTYRKLTKERAKVVIEWIDYLKGMFKKNSKEIVSVRELTGLPDNVPLFPARSIGKRYGKKIFSQYPRKVPKPISTFTLWKIINKACRMYLPAKPKVFMTKRYSLNEEKYRGQLITPYCPYGFRRMVITERLNPNNREIFMPPWRLQKLMGWKSLNTVMKYDKWSSREVAEEETEKDIYYS